jgi:hypothetical protein
VSINLNLKCQARGNDVQIKKTQLSIDQHRVKYGRQFLGRKAILNFYEHKKK